MITPVGEIRLDELFGDLFGDFFAGMEQPIDLASKRVPSLRVPFRIKDLSSSASSDVHAGLARM
ncbi:hypothetical protein L6654_00705 [Bradyrhizobium sp. WYCCWR 13023]|uniref:Uncharacterized protein n=1 Tax=Bradyrhizobium zhengyangense TaxID=2911009 RepID=A0A9X1U4Z3_9BRAD|nr:hypothetical protein [Bradyrhizobium zhengyangense]MCG2625125.1 hypothetical protein [Bradyrhizobium zhengyangense]